MGYGGPSRTPQEAVSALEEAIQIIRFVWNMEQDGNDKPLHSHLFNLFYHAEYLIALITGVFGNLALLTKDRYGIRHDIIKVSFSNEDFMKKVEASNIALKKHVDQYRDFISLIYKFREQVIHREGLIQVISPIVINWSSFIKITSEISKYIKQCGDAKSEYKFISNWGVFERGSDLFLDPYYFSKQALFTVLKLTNEYLQQLN